MMKRRINLLYMPYILLFGVVIAMFISMFDLSVNSNVKFFDITSPLVFCILIAIALLICVLISLISDIRKSRKTVESEEKTSVVELTDLRLIAFFVIGLILYVVLLPILHFGLGTFIFMGIAMFYFNKSVKKIPVRLFKVLLSSAIIVPIILYVFSGIFNVKLP